MSDPLFPDNGGYMRRSEEQSEHPPGNTNSQNAVDIVNVASAESDQYGRAVGESYEVNGRPGNVTQSHSHHHSAYSTPPAHTHLAQAEQTNPLASQQVYPPHVQTPSQHQANRAVVGGVMQQINRQSDASHDQPFKTPDHSPYTYNGLGLQVYNHDPHDGSIQHHLFPRAGVQQTRRSQAVQQHSDDGYLPWPSSANSVYLANVQPAFTPVVSVFNADYDHNQRTYHTILAGADNQHNPDRIVGISLHAPAINPAQPPVLSLVNSPAHGEARTGNGFGTQDQTYGDAETAAIFDDISASLQAQAYTTLRQPLRLENRRDDIDFVKQQREDWIDRLFDALRDVPDQDDEEDEKLANGLDRIDKYLDKLESLGKDRDMWFEACAINVYDAVMDVHTHGGPRVRDTVPVNVRSICSERMEAVVGTISREASVRLDVIKGKCLHQLVANPSGAEGKKKSNAHHNKIKTRQIADGKEMQAARLRGNSNDQSAAANHTESAAMNYTGLPIAQDQEGAGAGSEEGLDGNGQNPYWIIPSPGSRPQEQFDFS